MAIQTAGEFQIQLGDVILRADRLVSDRPRDTALANARRSLGQLGDKLKRGDKLGPLDRKNFSTALEAVNQRAGGDDAFKDRVADLEDFIEANYKA